MTILQNPYCLYELFAALAAVPLFVLYRRAGVAPWPVVTIFVPLVGLAIAASFLAFPRWPALPPRPPKKKGPMRKETR